MDPLKYLLLKKIWVGLINKTVSGLRSRYCTVCNSININRQFNLTLINLTPRIKHPGDPRDSLLPFPSLFFCLQFVQISKRNSLSLSYRLTLDLSPAHPWSNLHHCCQPPRVPHHYHRRCSPMWPSPLLRFSHLTI